MLLKANSPDKGTTLETKVDIIEESERVSTYVVKR